MIHNRSRSRLATFLALIFATIGYPPLLDAAQLAVTWSDNSANEDGFNVERRVGTAGTYGQLASVGINVNSYADGNLLNSTTYCYRVRSYNSAGPSGYSNEGCATTAAATTSYTLTVSKGGTGTGTVTGTGINCGADCSEPFASGTSVALTATAASGSTFAGWSGTGCSTGTVAVNGNMACTATFNLMTYTLTVSKGGTGSGTVTGTGINCGADCSEPFASATSVVLTAAAASGSTFAGWSGGGCTGTASTCAVTMSAATTVTATFNASTFTLTVSKSGTGTGTVTGTGISCGADCTEVLASGTSVVLTAAAASGSTFAGWSGGGCTGTSTCTVTMSTATTVTASFNAVTFSLTVNKSGTGSGTVTSSPAGINCGATCSGTYTSGTSVVLTATAASGSTFAGWSGACTGTGACMITMNGAMSAIATFSAATQIDTVPPPGPGNPIVALLSAGETSVSFSVLWAASIDQPSNTAVPTYTYAAGYNDGSAPQSGTVSVPSLSLTMPYHSSGAAQTGWICVAATDAAGNKSIDQSCNAIPVPANSAAPATNTLTIVKAGTGTGTVTGTGINCGADCSEPFASGTSVALTATAASGSTFAGWSGTGCSTGTAAVNGNMTCTATFNIGVAAQLTVVWTDNSTNEDGFNIERRVGTAGTYGQLASVGINVNSYTDSNLLNSTTYCYRVRSYNSAGFSGYSNEGCATTAAATTSYTLTVSKGGTGTGTVTGTGISCGADCSEVYTGGTSVMLTATAASGSTFTGWSGTGCSTGTVAVNGNMTCTATFNLNTSTLTVSKSGTGTGTVTGTGISCGADCTEVLASGTSVVLTAAAASGSTFAGWSGGGCTGTSTCTVTTSIAITVTATFNLNTFSLTVIKGGTGTGTVTGTGINCGADCSEVYTGGTSVVLTATAASGSNFAGWSGTGCGTGTVAVNGNMTCTATFNLLTYALTMNVAGEVTTAGSAGGRITSSPVGIDCGTDCSENYQSGQAVALIPVANVNSIFTGWSGDADCADGSVTMNAHKSCTANFGLKLIALTVTKSGSGTVSSTPAGIDCGMTCSYNYVSGSAVGLHATPAAGFIFAGWSGGGCTGTTDCSVTLTSARTIMANFVNDRNDKVGVFRPSTGEWFLDQNGNGIWDGCEIDACVPTFNSVGALPVVGDWDGSGSTKLGLYLSGTAQWWLDIDGSRTWDGCAADQCLGSFGAATDIPTAGQWKTSGTDRIGTFRPSNGSWYLDANTDGTLSCRRDLCFRFNNYLAGDLPVAGDWTGAGLTRVGLYRPSTGEWFLDRNGNRSWSGCSKDTCVSNFGTPEDLPVAGDWAGTGVSRIGVFRPATGDWMLDLNGNGKWDGCGVDLCISGFGAAGDIPFVGRW